MHGSWRTSRLATTTTNTTQSARNENDGLSRWIHGDDDGCRRKNDEEKTSLNNHCQTLTPLKLRRYHDIAWHHMNQIKPSRRTSGKTGNYKEPTEVPRIDPKTAGLGMLYPRLGCTVTHKTPFGERVSDSRSGCCLKAHHLVKTERSRITNLVDDRQETLPVVTGWYGSLIHKKTIQKPTPSRVPIL